MAIRCAVRSRKLKHIVTSTIEHHAVGHTIDRLKAKALVDVTYVHLDENGHVDLQHLDQILSTSTKTLVSLMHANNDC